MWITSSLGSRLVPIFHLSNCFLWDPSFPLPPFSAYKIFWSKCWIPRFWTGCHVVSSPTTPEGFLPAGDQRKKLEGLWWLRFLALNLYLSSRLPPYYLQGWMEEKAPQPRGGCQQSDMNSLQLGKASWSCLSHLSLACEMVANYHFSRTPCFLSFNSDLGLWKRQIGQGVATGCVKYQTWGPHLFLSDRF